MTREFQLLPHRFLANGAKLQNPSPLRGRVRLDSPALEVMTDFRQTAPATIDPETPLDAANRFMIRRGVRLLLVTDERSEILGLITATDILGERPVKFALDRGIRRQDILVRDIMRPRERLEVLWYEDLVTAQVGHIVATLKAVGRQHALAAEPSQGSPGELVRGVFSLSQIARQLGIQIAWTEVARTFGEIEAALGR